MLESQHPIPHTQTPLSTLGAETRPEEYPHRGQRGGPNELPHIWSRADQGGHCSGAGAAYQLPGPGGGLWAPTGGIPVAASWGEGRRFCSHITSLHCHPGLSACSHTRQPVLLLAWPLPGVRPCPHPLLDRQLNLPHRPSPLSLYFQGRTTWDNFFFFFLATNGLPK